MDVVCHNTIYNLQNLELMTQKWFIAMDFFNIPYISHLFSTFRITVSSSAKNTEQTKQIILCANDKIRLYKMLTTPTNLILMN